MERRKSEQTTYEDFLYDLNYHNLLVNITNVSYSDISERLRHKAVLLPESLSTSLWMESFSWTEVRTPNYPGVLFLGFNDPNQAYNDPKFQDALATVELSVPSLGYTNPSTCDLRISGVTIDSEGDKRLLAVTYNLDPRKKREENSWTVADINVGITNSEFNDVDFIYTSTDTQPIPTNPIYPYKTAGLITQNMANCVNQDIEKKDYQARVLRINRSEIQTILERRWINQFHFLHEKPIKILGRTLRDRPNRYRIGLYNNGKKPWEVSIPAKLD